jgi:hypothetical protein
MAISSLCAFTVSVLSNGTLVSCTVVMLLSSILCAILFSTAASKEPEVLSPSSGG